MEGTCEPVKAFNFYSLDEFDYQQLISKSRYKVGSYINRETTLNYVIKEIPYDEQTLQVLRKIDKLRHHNITPLLGVSLLRSKRNPYESLRLKAEQKESKECLNLLLFM